MEWFDHVEVTPPFSRGEEISETTKYIIEKEDDYIPSIFITHATKFQATKDIDLIISEPSSTLNESEGPHQFIKCCACSTAQQEVLVYLDAARELEDQDPLEY